MSNQQTIADTIPAGSSTQLPKSSVIFYTHGTDTIGITTSNYISPSGEIYISIGVDNSLDYFGPVPVIPSWTPTDIIFPFSNQKTKSLTASVSLQLPYSQNPGQSNISSSNQIVLYIGLLDITTNNTIAYGLILFDSRGVSSSYYSLDNGIDGTNAAIINTPSGENSEFTVIVPNTNSFQTGPWLGYRNFALEITPETLLNAIETANLEIPNSQIPYSTNVANYIIKNVSIDSEIEYYGTSNAFDYSIKNFQVNLNDQIFQGTSIQEKINSIFNGALPETISANVDYQITIGSGNFCFFAGENKSTIYGGSGLETINGQDGAITAIGGTNNNILISGSLGENLLVSGYGSTTINASTSNSDTIFGGIFENTYSTIIGGTGNLIVSENGSSLIYTGTDQSTIFGNNGYVTIVSIGKNFINLQNETSKIFIGSSTDTIFANAGNTTIVGGSHGSFINTNSGTTDIFSGTGINTIFASGYDYINVNSGGSLIIENQFSQEHIDLGYGSATVFEEYGINYYSFIENSDSFSTDYIFGFKPYIDEFVLPSQISINDVLKSSISVGWGTEFQIGLAKVIFGGLMNSNGIF